MTLLIIIGPFSGRGVVVCGFLLYISLLVSFLDSVVQGEQFLCANVYSSVCDGRLGWCKDAVLLYSAPMELPLSLTDICLQPTTCVLIDYVLSLSPTLSHLIDPLDE
jgi:hypothetical protein